MLGVVNRKADLESWWADEDIEIEDLQVDVIILPTYVLCSC